MITVMEQLRNDLWRLSECTGLTTWQVQAEMKVLLKYARVDMHKEYKGQAAGLYNFNRQQCIDRNRVFK